MMNTKILVSAANVDQDKAAQNAQPDLRKSGLCGKGLTLICLYLEKAFINVAAVCLFDAPRSKIS